MILEKTEIGNEHTEETLIKKLNEKFHSKKNNQPFTKNDIIQYSIRGKLPRPYGNNRITILEQYGIKLFLVEGEL